MRLTTILRYLVAVTAADVCLTACYLVMLLIRSWSSAEPIYSAAHGLIFLFIPSWFAIALLAAVPFLIAVRYARSFRASGLSFYAASGGASGLIAMGLLVGLSKTLLAGPAEQTTPAVWVFFAILILAGGVSGLGGGLAYGALLVRARTLRSKAEDVF